MKEIHKAYEKYIGIIQIIPLEDLKEIHISLKINADKIKNQIMLVSEELARRGLK